MDWTQIAMIIGYILVTLINVIYSAITSWRTGKKAAGIKGLEDFTIDYPLLQELISDAEKLDGCTGKQKFNYVFIEYITRKTEKGVKIDKNAVQTAINAIVSLTKSVNVKTHDDHVKSVKTQNTGLKRQIDKSTDADATEQLNMKVKNNLAQLEKMYDAINPPINDPPFPMD